MYLSPYDYFSEMSPYMSQLLISRSNFSEIQSLAMKFPENLTRVTGVECHLGMNAPHADWGFEILNREDSKLLLAHFIRDEIAAGSFFQGRAWHNIGAFSALWNDTGSVLFENIRAVWFEFDTTNQPGIVPIPCVFLVPAYTLKEEFLSSNEWLLETAIPVLTGADCPGEIKETFVRCIEKLPFGSSLFIIGLMFQRKSRKIRLSIKFDDPLNILHYLNDIGWPGEKRSLSLLIDDMIQCNVNRFILDLDIGEKISPLLGLECSFCPTNYHKEHKWSDLLHKLIEKGLISHGECDAVLSYPGSDFSPCPSWIGIDNPRDTAQIRSPVLIRYISHLKFVHNPSEPLAVKAYIGIRQMDPEVEVCNDPLLVRT
ncbi:MAG: hypothetical protein LLF84_06965 [Methanoregulaceae archaeon]|jgi:hypothetical protein|nr:hypothetical protein [Methanoregulaceae archaeon]